MKSLYEGKYKEGQYFNDYKKVKILREALDHPLVDDEWGLEFYGPNEGWQTEGYMYRVNLSHEGMHYWVSDEIGEHMAAINIYGTTKKEAREEVFWLLNESFSFKEQEIRAEERHYQDIY